MKRTRNQLSPLAELANRVRAKFADSAGWSVQEYTIFCEVESVLYLYEQIVSDPTERSYRDAWTYISGYDITDNRYTNECLTLRKRIRYVKTATAWRHWSAWYFRRTLEHDGIGLFRLVLKINDSDDPTRFERAPVDVFAYQERLEIYRYTVDPLKLSSAEEQRPDYAPAPAGKYVVRIGEGSADITISEGMLKYVEEHRTSTVSPVKRTKPAPIMVDLKKLSETAQTMDDLERSIGVAEPGNWRERLSTLFFVLHKNGAIQEGESKLAVDGLFHLVGLLGVGKSSLIAVLTYHLATLEQKHVTVLFGTVVETIRFAAWLRTLGVIAAPALGRDRVSHATKYALANADQFDSSNVFRDNIDNPAFRWMAVPCALRGMSNGEPILVGQEPCYSLRDDQGERYSCPLIPVCPVHTLYRDLAESQVWTVNPQSFLYSSIPDPAQPDRRVRLLEAVYDRSDLVIIDEADRVQVVWDQIYAPTRPLAGSDDSFLDKLHRVLADRSVGTTGRRNSQTASMNSLIDQDAHAHQLSSTVFRLIGRFPHLAKWLKGEQITNKTLFQMLGDEITDKLHKSTTDAEKVEIRAALDRDFTAFWRNPLHRESGALADWLTTFMLTNAETAEVRHLRNLKKWLLNYVPALRKHKELSQVVRKIQLSVLLSATIKRANDLQYQRRWAETLYDAFRDDQPELADEIADLTPDPPLGRLLGVRHLGYDASNKQPGKFHFLRYLGIGRWLLLNLPTLHAHEGRPGPHVLLTSATSWLPESAQFHIAASPDAILAGHRGNHDVRFKLLQVKNELGNVLKVSGEYRYRQQNLQRVINALIENGDLQKELDHWQRYDRKRAILLVVNSYEQAEWVYDAVMSHPEWEDRAVRLIRDDDESHDEGALRARKVETFAGQEADLLIAPLMTIQRGFNILDSDDRALLGSVFFLVRPYPPPDDLTPQILGMNKWVIDQFAPGYRSLRSDKYPAGKEGLLKFRRRAYGQWSRRITHVRYGLKQLTDEMYLEYVCDLFITLWQTVGRTLRGSSDARVFFVDGAFAPPDGKRHAIRDIYNHLQSLRDSGDVWTAYLARKLYDLAFDALHKGFESKELI